MKGNSHVQVICVKYSHDSIQLPSITRDGRQFLAKDTGVSEKAEIHNIPRKILQKMYHCHTDSAEALRTPKTEGMLAKRTE